MTEREHTENNTLGEVVMCMNKSDMIAKLFAKRLESGGMRVHWIEDQVRKDSVSFEEETDIIVVDGERDDDICDKIKLHQNGGKIAVAAINAKQENGQKKICVIPDEQLPESIELDELFERIAKQVCRVRENKRRGTKHFAYIFPAAKSLLEQASVWLEEFLKINNVSESDSINIIMAFREACDNAIKHGSKHNDELNVKVICTLDSEKAVIAVEDQGDGFNAPVHLELQRLVTPAELARQRAKEGKRGGLGIVMILQLMDSVEYNNTGNVIKFTYYLGRERSYD